jgi:hypothetical protein
MGSEGKRLPTLVIGVKVKLVKLISLTFFRHCLKRFLGSLIAINPFKSF